jgi:flagellar basal-body rod modification protein FlgD
VTVDPTTASAVSPSQSSSASPVGTQALGRDAFLQLLITQLQHQDPTQPQDDAQFITQLAQFSSLEQLQQMNDRLATIEGVFKKL